MSACFYIFFISNPAFPVRLHTVPTLPHSSTLTAQGRVAQYNTYQVHTVQYSTWYKVYTVCAIHCEEGNPYLDPTVLGVGRLLLQSIGIVAAIDFDCAEALLPLEGVPFAEKERSEGATMAEPPEERPNGVNKDPNSTLVWAKVWDFLSPPPSNTMKVRCCLSLACIFIVIMSYPPPLFCREPSYPIF
jgi:hypothetical protein